MEKLVLNFVITFFLNMLSSWEQEVNWAALQAKLDDHINRFFPVKSMDKGLIAIVAFMFKTIQLILSETANLDNLLNAVSAGNWNGAKADLEALIVTAIPQLKGII